MQTVRQVLQGKGREVSTIGPEMSVYDALALMADKGIGALVVTQGPVVVGLMSERDYARNVALKGRNSRETPVGDIMTTRVACVGPDQTVQECMTIMTEMRVRHLPVMEGETLAGLVSIGDLVKAIIEEQEALIEHLVRYING
jgi:CBS domain-containing protein